MRPDVVDAALKAATATGDLPTLCLSPRGRPLDQARVRRSRADPACGCSAAVSKASTSA